MAEMKLTYKQEGDYLIPDMTMDAQPTQLLGKYGRMRESYLKNHKRGIYATMFLNCTIQQHLIDIDQQANEAMEQAMHQLLKVHPVPDKATDQMGWVQHMNMLKAQAEEAAMEIIYS